MYREADEYVRMVDAGLITPFTLTEWDAQPADWTERVVEYRAMQHRAATAKRSLKK